MQTFYRRCKHKVASRVKRSHPRNAETISLTRWRQGNTLFSLTVGPATAGIYDTQRRSKNKVRIEACVKECFPLGIDKRTRWT